MTLDGEVIGGAARPSSEWKLHQRTYRVRPDVNAVVHLHPQHAVLVDALGHRDPADHPRPRRTTCVRSGRCPTSRTAPTNSPIRRRRAGREHDCIVLSHHGCSALGADIGMAYRRALNLEEAATATYRCLAVGDTTCTFPPEAFAELHHG